MSEQPHAGQNSAGASDQRLLERIGVRGDGSCPELTQLRSLPQLPGLLRRRRGSARSPPRRTNTSPSGRVISQNPNRPRSGDPFGRHLSYRRGMAGVADGGGQEVTNLRPIHSLPHRRSGVMLGLANVRGELLICVSLAMLLGVAPAAAKRDNLHPPARAVARDPPGRRARRLSSR